MSRQNHVKSDRHPYHVRVRTADQKVFPIPLSQVWNFMGHELQRASHGGQLRIHAVVLMNNHFHLLCQTPSANLEGLMQGILRRLSHRINHGPLWDRYKWTLIEAPQYYYQVYRYIYQNPLRAGIVEKVEDYPFSSLQNVPFPLCSHVPLTFGGHEGEYLWLNERYTSEDLKLIRLGLRKFQFDVNKRKISTFGKLSAPLMPTS